MTTSHTVICEPRREEICGIISYKWKVSPVEECDK